MIKAWCYICSSWNNTVEYDPYRFYEDGQKMPNISKLCIPCLKKGKEFRDRFEAKRQEIAQRKLEKLYGES